MVLELKMVDLTQLFFFLSILFYFYFIFIFILIFFILESSKIYLLQTLFSLYLHNQ